MTALFVIANISISTYTCKFQYTVKHFLITENSSASQEGRFLDAIKLNLELGSHPNISSIIGCVTIEEPYCIITEFVKYRNLFTFLQKCRQVSAYWLFPLNSTHPLWKIYPEIKAFHKGILSQSKLPFWPLPHVIYTPSVVDMPIHLKTTLPL